MQRFPAVFIGHGSPLQIREGAPGTAFLRRLGAELGKPQAILIASAHWETASPAVGGAEWPETICDFYGFPPEFYSVTYPAPGAPDVARLAAAMLTAAGFDAGIDPGQGLDHGAWVPLRLMYPGADVPVAQLSLQHHLGPAHHLAVGRALAPLRGEGVLVLGAGNLTHNLRAMMGRPLDAESAPEPWVTEFTAWVDDAARAGRMDDLADYRARAPHAAKAHPRDEHYLPLLIAAGAGGEGARATRLNDEVLFGTLSQAAYAFDTASAP